MAITRKSIEDTQAEQGVKYTVANPHPAFGTDPNILNEYGHTQYPKWVDHPTEKAVHTSTQTFNGTLDSKLHVHETKFPKKVLVHNEKEENALLGKTAKKADWGKSKDGE